MISKPAVQDNICLGIKGRTLLFSVDSDDTVYHSPTGQVIGSIRMLRHSGGSPERQLETSEAVTKLVDQQIKSHGPRDFFGAIGLGGNLKDSKMNNPELLEYAKRCGISFDLMASDGRVELMFHTTNNGTGPIFILENPTSGDGVMDLEQQTGVLCYPDPKVFSNGVEAIFPTAKKAIEHLADPDFRSALIWETSQGKESDEIPESALAEVVWSADTAAYIENFDFTYQQMVDQILKDSECEVVIV